MSAASDVAMHPADASEGITAAMQAIAFIRVIDVTSAELYEGLEFHLDVLIDSPSPSALLDPESRPESAR